MFKSDHVVYLNVHKYSLKTHSPIPHVTKGILNRSFSPLEYYKMRYLPYDGLGKNKTVNSSREGGNKMKMRGGRGGLVSQQSSHCSTPIVASSIFTINF